MNFFPKDYRFQLKSFIVNAPPPHCILQLTLVVREDPVDAAHAVDVHVGHPQVLDELRVNSLDNVE